jgi:hypothetical protein
MVPRWGRKMGTQDGNTRWEHKMVPRWGRKMGTQDGTTRWFRDGFASFTPPEMYGGAKRGSSRGPQAPGLEYRQNI